MKVKRTIKLILLCSILVTLFTGLVKNVGSHKVLSQNNNNNCEPNYQFFNTFYVFDNIDQDSSEGVFDYINRTDLPKESFTVNTSNGIDEGLCCPNGTELWYKTPTETPIINIGSFDVKYTCCPLPKSGYENIVATDESTSLCSQRIINSRTIDFKDDQSVSDFMYTIAQDGDALATGVAKCDEDIKSTSKTCPTECPAFPVTDGINTEAIICKRPNNNPLSNPAIAAQSPQVLTAYGNACVPQLASCATFSGKRNLVEALKSGTILSNDGWSMDLSTVMGDLRREFNADLNNICIDENITGIISFKLPWLRLSDPASYIYHASNGETILRGCTTGFVPSTAPDSGAGEVSPFNSGWSITGCCSRTQQFVTPANRLSLSGSEYQVAGRCCELEGSVRGDSNFPYQTDGDACFNAQGAKLRTAETNLSQIGGIDFGLGSGQYSTDNTQTSLLCPPTSDCVVTGKDGKRPKVDHPNKLATDTSLACFRCYENGDAVQVDVEAKVLLTCNNGTLVETALINDSVASTLAFLREKDVNGIENADALESCLNRGGIYVAIGCVDPTPLGVITGLIRIAFGVMGGVSLIQLILAGIAYQSGDEAKIQQAREKVISTITGVALLVFSVLILRIIGINILDVVPVGSF